MTITADQVVQAYVKTREELDAMEEAYTRACLDLKVKQEKREAWLQANLTPSDRCAFVDPATAQVVVGTFPEKLADYMVQRYIDDRDLLAALSKEASEISAPLVTAQAARVQWFKTELNTTGAEGMKTAHGTVFWENVASATVGDANAFMAWVHEDWEERRGFLNNAVNKTAVKARLEESLPVPPGVNYSTFRDVKVRRK